MRKRNESLDMRTLLRLTGCVLTTWYLLLDSFEGMIG